MAYAAFVAKCPIATLHRDTSASVRGDPAAVDTRCSCNQVLKFADLMGSVSVSIQVLCVVARLERTGSGRRVHVDRQNHVIAAV